MIRPLPGLPRPIAGLARCAPHDDALAAPTRSFLASLLFFLTVLTLLCHFHLGLPLHGLLGYCLTLACSRIPPARALLSRGRFSLPSPSSFTCAFFLFFCPLRPCPVSFAHVRHALSVPGLHSALYPYVFLGAAPCLLSFGAGAPSSTVPSSAVFSHCVARCGVSFALSLPPPSESACLGVPSFQFFLRYERHLVSVLRFCNPLRASPSPAFLFAVVCLAHCSCASLRVSLVTGRIASPS